MRRSALAIVLLLLAGCLPRVAYHEPTPPAPPPAAWQTSGRDAGVEEPWLADFGDPLLVDLVGEAWEHNQDLLAAEAGLRRARAVAEQAGALRQPSLDLGAAAGRARNVSEVGGRLITGTANSYRLEASLSWEADLWGRLGAGARAARAEFTASAADLAAGRLSLAASVCEAWFQLAHDRLQRDLARAYLDNFHAAIEMVRRRWTGGEARLGDLHLIRAEAAQAEAELRRRERLFDASSRAMALLLGRYPRAELTGADDLPAPPAALAAGLPAELLWRRPDLQAAAERLLAGNQRLRVARADLLPRISLTAGAGARSGEIENVLDPDYLFWNLLGNLLAPIWDGGRRRAVVRERQDQADASLAQYRAAALQAFREVEQGLAGEEFLRAELAAQRRSLDEQERSLAATLDSYDDGQGDALDVLTQSRNTVAKRQRVLTLRLQLLSNRLGLYKAIGGPAIGDPDDESIPSARPAEEKP